MAAGPLVGGAVTQGLSWHWVFWVNVPVAVVAALGSMRFLPESVGPRARLDLPALALISGGGALAVWGLVQGPSTGWTSGPVITALLFAVVTLVAFVAWEGRVEEPMIPLSLFAVWNLSSAVTATFLMAASIYSAAFLTSQYFQFSLGDSPLQTGLRLLPWTATPLLVAPAAGALADRIGEKALILTGLCLQAAGYFWIAAVTGHHATYLQLVPPFVIAGVGVSMILPSSSIAVLNSVAPSALGKASGVLNTLRQFGAVLGIAITTAVFTANGSLQTAQSVVHGYRPAIFVAAMFSLAGVGPSLLLVRRSGSLSVGRSS
ncbi:MAG: MFS transporter [Acidobacteriota bacterium]|nr:MFS transporter [Acidobacteriota bacterium]